MLTAPISLKVCKMVLQSESLRSSAQSFTLRQQATMKITQQVHSVIACLHHIYTVVILHAHPVW